MSFIAPMLATRLEDPRRLADPRYSAEPKLDGQRAQLHVRDHRTVHAFSRPGRELIRLLYRPGIRSPAWLKLKPKLTLEVVVTGGSAARIRWGDWGEAVMLELRYTHPRTGADVEVRQAVRVPRDQPFDLRIGARLELVCWGVMPSGQLRHPVLCPSAMVFLESARRRGRTPLRDRGPAYAPHRVVEYTSPGSSRQQPNDPRLR